MRTFALAMTIACLAPSVASAAPEMVVDSSTGRVLYEREARRAWRPASLTKLMTTYVALAEVAAGRVNPDAPVTVSRRASTAPPSRSGLPVGSRVSLGDALKILMVKSANDIAVAVAEAVGGDEAAFVAMMNRESARLGMTSSRWRNPHGLDADGQVTTARDLAVLALALRRDFPAMEGLWSIGAISLRGAVMSNHNGAVGRYARSDGMKTGYTCASGFNVVSTASQDGRRVAAVLLGRSSASERDARASLLLEAALRAPVPATAAGLDAYAGSAAAPAPKLGCGGGADAGDDYAGAGSEAVQEWVRAFARMPRALGEPVPVAVLPPAAAVVAAPREEPALSSVVSAYAPARQGPAAMPSPTPLVKAAPPPARETTPPVVRPTRF